jgi:hypothetical protein
MDLIFLGNFSYPKFLKIKKDFLERQTEKNYFNKKFQPINNFSRLEF